MKLITEEISSVKFITEGKGGKKKLYIEGVFLQGDLKNRNGRMYPIDTLSREVDRYNESFVGKGRALGELGHPEGPTVNLDRVSHKITSLVREGNNMRYQNTSPSASSTYSITVTSDGTVSYQMDGSTVFTSSATITSSENDVVWTSNNNGGVGWMRIPS